MRDNTCGITYYSDGTPVDHVIVTGSNPYTLNFADASGFCERAHATTNTFSGYNFQVQLQINSAPTAGSEPFIAGGGVQNAPFGITAHGIGAAATGQLTEAFASGLVRVSVTCLRVSGNDAIVTGIVTHGVFGPGPIVVFEGVDNGGPVHGVSPDLQRLSGQDAIYPDPSDTTGRCYQPFLPPVSVKSGNIVVSAGG